MSPRIIWSFTIVGLVVAAIARFAASDVEGLGQLEAIAWGIVLSLVVIGLLVSVLAIPGIIRRRALGRERPGTRILSATVKFSADGRDRHAREPDDLYSDGGMSLAVVLTTNEVEFWSGTGSPRMVFSVATSSITTVTSARVQLPVSRFWGVVLACDSGGAPDHVVVVPHSLLLVPYTRGRTQRLAQELSSWLVASRA